jgi:hypothetical protein
MRSILRVKTVGVSITDPLRSIQLVTVFPELYGSLKVLWVNPTGLPYFQLCKIMFDLFLMGINSSRFALAGNFV